MPTMFALVVYVFVTDVRCFEFCESILVDQNVPESWKGRRGELARGSVAASGSRRGGMYSRNSKNELKPAKRPHVRVNVHRFYFLIFKLNVISRHSCFVFITFFFCSDFRQIYLILSFIYIYKYIYKTIMFESGRYPCAMDDYVAPIMF